MLFRRCLLYFTVLALGACGQTSESQLSGAIQGTTYHIKWVLDDSGPTLEQVRAEVENTFREADQKLSNWRDDSEISGINRQRTTDWLPASREIVELIGIANEVAKKTGGCYDLTVKPLLDLWGFSKHDPRVPDAQEITKVLSHIGMDKLEVDAGQNRIRKKDPELTIDLSSIAQGYTVGMVASRLEAMGIRDYLAEVGGEMMVKGSKADGSPWRVAIEKPTPFAREVQRILELGERQGTAIMTAGTYRNFFENEGKTYSHIIDPRTGRPVSHRLLSVTVLHRDPTWADAWDTALLCVGDKAGAEIAEREQLRALFISAEGKSLTEWMSTTFTSAPKGSALLERRSPNLDIQTPLRQP